VLGITHDRLVQYENGSQPLDRAFLPYIARAYGARRNALRLAGPGASVSLVAVRLRDRRVALGLSHHAIARRIPCGLSTLTNIENGTVALNPPLICSFAKVYGLSIADILRPDEHGTDDDIVPSTATRRSNTPMPG